jgi:hypothetical protein
VKRTVTTDAASAHADKDAVPEVRFSSPPPFHLPLLPIIHPIEPIDSSPVGNQGNWALTSSGERDVINANWDGI